MKKPLVIATYTLREALHQPVVWVIVAGSAVVLAVVAQMPRFSLSVFKDMKTLQDLALGTGVMAGVLVGIFSAIHVVTTEIENLAVITVLSKPVRRWEFVLGKFLGLALTLTAVYAAMLVLYTLLVWWGMWVTMREYRVVWPEVLARFWHYAWVAADQMWRGMAISLLQAVVLASVAVACCVRAPVVLSALIYFFVFVLGHFAAPITRGLHATGTWVGNAGSWVVGTILPNLETLNYAQALGQDFHISIGMLALSFLYALLYSAAFVLLGVLLFRGREVL